MDIYEQIAGTHGFISLGRGRGVYYGTVENLRHTPRGWLFVDRDEIKTGAEIRALVDQYLLERES